MILVSLGKTWPRILPREATPSWATLRAWPVWPRQQARLTDFAVEQLCPVAIDARHIRFTCGSHESSRGERPSPVHHPSVMSLD